MMVSGEKMGSRLNEEETEKKYGKFCLVNYFAIQIFLLNLFHGYL